MIKKLRLAGRLQLLNCEVYDAGTEFIVGTGGQIPPTFCHKK